MDIILLVSIITLFVLSFLCIRFLRFAKQTAGDQARTLSQTKKQTDMTEDVLGKQEAGLEQALLESRTRMIALFEKRAEKDAKQAGEELNSRISAYIKEVCSRVDSHVASSLARADADISAYKQEKISTMDDRVRACIQKAARTSIAKGLSMDVHEAIVDRAIKEAVSEIIT